MKTDAEIQKDVMDELKWDPFLNSSEIGVAVKNGIVTLSGQVETYSKKIFAERAVKRVAGVKAVAEDIHVGPSPVYNKTDTEIAQAVVNAFKWHTVIPEGKITVKVEDGQVLLNGEVDWEFERESAKKAVENLPGVRSVTNLIRVGPRASVADIQKKINAAFHRSATIDSGKVVAEVIGNKVILRGKVRSFSEKEDAEKAAWAAEGVSHVESHLEIAEPEYAF